MTVSEKTLEGRVAVTTGGSTGFGRAIAREHAYLCAETTRHFGRLDILANNAARRGAII